MVDIEKEKESIDEMLLDQEFWNVPVPDDDLAGNKRITVRYLRDDITLSLKKPNIFGLGKPSEAQLLDVSSRGALFSTDKKLKCNQQITLLFGFTDGAEFEFKATVIRIETKGDLFYYGVKFKQINHELGEHLLQTQEDLKLK